ncbi:unnamed protein product [Auanema sp. JU1783]|nr:unnamed protein product [Auanema sp. JU1783]
MGTDIDSQNGGNNSYVEAVVRLSAIIWQHERFPWLWIKPIWYLTGLGYEFDRLVKLTTDFTRNVIAQRKKEMDYQETLNENHGTKQKAFLDLMLFMQKENKLSDEDIREEVDTFMFEGHDTTASSIGFTLWWLGQKPECHRLVQEEVDQIFGDSDRMPTTEDIKKMIYLEKCIKESLRLMPSVPLLARRLEEDVDMKYCTLPKGMTVVVAPMACQRDPREFEFPDDFHPEHFDFEKTVKRDPYSYIPFSAGPRNCIGQKFAILEEKIVLSYVLRYFNVETEVPAPGNRPIPEIILKPTLGFSLKFTNRKESVSC